MSTCKWCGEEYLDEEMTWHGAPGADGRNSDECELTELRKLRDRLIVWGVAWEALNYASFDGEAGESAFDDAKDTLIDERDAIIARAKDLAK